MVFFLNIKYVLFRQWVGSEEEGGWERSRLEKLRKEKDRLQLRTVELEMEKGRLEVEKGRLVSEKGQLETRLVKVERNLETAEQIIRELSEELQVVKGKYRSERKTRISSLGSGGSRSSAGDGSKSEEENQNLMNELELRTRGQEAALSDLKLQREKTERILNLEKESLQRYV